MRVEHKYVFVYESLFERIETRSVMKEAGGKKRGINRESRGFFGTWTFSKASRLNPSAELNPEF